MTLVARIPPLAIRTKLFERGDYRFITDKDGQTHKQQAEALRLLNDKETVEFMYGGAAGGAKSWTGCTNLLFKGLLYPGTRYFIGREELKRLRESTLITFFKVAKAYGAVSDVDYRYHGQDHYIQFANGSRIDLLDLSYKPSDPLYERYGSTEYTEGWIEEAGETHFGAFDVLKSRVGRHMNDHYNLVGKIFVTANPKKNWIYTYFYKPSTNGTLPEGRVFLRAFLQDNPFRESGYESKLQSLSSSVMKARLLYGEFDYDDDPTALCDYDAIADLFTNEHVLPTGQRAISADLAMQGRDRFIAGVWFGNVLDLTKGLDKPKATGKSIETDLKTLMVQHSVPRSQTVADSDGMGAYLESYLTGIKEFHGGTKAIDSNEFANLKSECGYKLAELINKREMRIICSAEQRQRITEELAVLKAQSVDNDETRKRIIKKDMMKELLGRSPDYLDMLLMKMLFHVQSSGYKMLAY